MKRFLKRFCSNIFYIFSGPERRYIIRCCNRVDNRTKLAMLRDVLKELHVYKDKNWGTGFCSLFDDISLIHHILYSCSSRIIVIDVLEIMYPNFKKLCIDAGGEIDRPWYWHPKHHNARIKVTNALIEEYELKIKKGDNYE